VRSSREASRKWRDLHAAGLKFWDKLLNLAELCGADWSVVGRVRKQNSPGIAYEVMELDSARCGISFKVRHSFSKIQRHLKRVCY
jgi:hypothetical protein